MVWGRESVSCEQRGRGPRPKENKMSPDVQKQLGAFSQLWGSPEAEEESEEGSDESEEETLRFKPPGGATRSHRKKEKKAKGKSSVDDLMMQLLSQQAAANSQMPDLTPFVLMKLLDKDARKGRRSRRAREEDSSSGGSDSDVSGNDDKDKGMKAVKTLHHMQQRIVDHPKKIIREFEREVIQDLGVVVGQSWTLKDWVKRQPWSKFKGIQRCAMQDVAVIELLRNQQPEAACAQAIQNLKSKVQCALQLGDWTSAWLLTGLVDPLAKKEFADTRNVGDLRPLVSSGSPQEAGELAGADDDDAKEGKK